MATSWLWSRRGCAPAGVSATRYSLFLTSVGTPMYMAPLRIFRYSVEQCLPDMRKKRSCTEKYFEKKADNFFRGILTKHFPCFTFAHIFFKHGHTYRKPFQALRSAAGCGQHFF